MNGFACLVLAAMCASFVAAAPAEVKYASSTSPPYVDVDDAEVTEYLPPAPVADGKPHNLNVGECRPEDQLIHSETIVVNNDENSRVAGDIRVNVQGAVNITCIKVLDQDGNASGAFPSYVSGGVGHNYVVLGFSTAQGYGFNFLIQLYGHNL